MSSLIFDVSSPRMSKYEMIFMACSRSSLAASKNSLAKPGLFIVSLEKWAPWNKTKLSHVSMNHCKWTSTMSVLHSVSPIYTPTHTQKTCNMAYNQDGLNFQQHTRSFPKGDMCNQLHHLQHSSIHKAQKLGSIKACIQWIKDSFISLHF